MKFVAKLRPGIAGAALLAVIAITGVGASAYADEVCPGGKVKYYRNPMGTPDTSPVPKKDSMNMDYIPVCENQTGDGPGTVKISLDKVQLLGVRSAEVQERALSRSIRAFATVQFDERRQFVVAPKFSGWIEKLYVTATGDAVTVGQDLLEVYSPELNVLQQQWRVAGRSADATDKLRFLAFPEAALEKLRRGESPSRTVTIPSPVAGTVVDKIAIEGMHFQTGDALFRIVDTSTMWVMAEVYEQDLAFVKVGDTAQVTVNAWPGQPIEGKVTFIYPTIGKESRTARLRIEVANPNGRLRADMAATVEIVTPLGSSLAAPDSAVIDSGRRQVVLVEAGEGRYEPRPVKLGARVPGWIQVLDGLRAGERVVTQATFLIDAESNIRAALAAFGAQESKGEHK
ncbi:MAG: CzcB family heavy metal efflux rane fusion protein [Reyranella sp.]|nr:CzcB family heavy metal efflux rane fusion protein [Reyranella sp.]